jgi:hypothetical protein
MHATLEHRDAGVHEPELGIAIRGSCLSPRAHRRCSGSKAARNSALRSWYFTSDFRMGDKLTNPMPHGQYRPFLAATGHQPAVRRSRITSRLVGLAALFQRHSRPSAINAGNDWKSGIVHLIVIPPKIPAMMMLVRSTVPKDRTLLASNRVAETSQMRHAARMPL